MLAKDVKIGEVYAATVSGKKTRVRITNIVTNKFTRRKEYEALNLVTSRKVVFKSAAKLSVLKAKASTPPEVPEGKEVEVKPTPTVAVSTPVTATVVVPRLSELSAKPSLGKLITDAVTPRINSMPHIIVQARAGTGKTTTLVEGLKVVKGMPTKIQPSDQQQSIWEAMTQGHKPTTVAFCAFNSSIANELKSRVPSGVEAFTVHSMGYRAVRSAFPRINKADGGKVKGLISELLEMSICDMQRTKPVVAKATEQLVKLCKMNLTDDLDYLVSHYQVDIESEDGVSYRDEIYDLVPRVLDRCRNVSRDTVIDFDDMIWLPVVLNLPCFRYDLLIVDEAQDLNRCQQSLARRCGNRLVLCGDDRQAIYGFAGADSESLPRMFKELSDTPEGCIQLPLTVTRRCGKLIVNEANRYVPDFTAHESNGEGNVSRENFVDPTGGTNSYHKRCVAGDMVLCRVNAPLVSECFKFLRQKRKAVIQGRDIGEGLISTVKKMKAVKVTDLLEKLGKWCSTEVEKEMAKKTPNEAKIISIQDRVDCLYVFCEECETVEEVIRNIESVFTDDKNVPAIRLSSVHKAKGLESKTVFILQPEGARMPHPMARSAWQVGQEYNLLYVAVTRAIENLVYVS